MSDGRDNAFARLESRILALEAEVKALRAQLEQQRAGYSANTLHLPKKAAA